MRRTEIIGLRCVWKGPRAIAVRSDHAFSSTTVAKFRPSVLPANRAFCRRMIRDCILALDRILLRTLKYTGRRAYPRRFQRLQPTNSSRSVKARELSKDGRFSERK